MKIMCKGQVKNAHGKLTVWTTLYSFIEITEHKESHIIREDQMTDNRTKEGASKQVALKPENKNNTMDFHEYFQKR